MYLTDFLVPMLIGSKDRKVSSSSTEDSLLRQANTYRDQLETLFKKKEQQLIRRNLSFFKEKIAPLDIDHKSFLAAVDYRIDEIKKMTGVSDEDKESLLIKANASSRFVIERHDKTVVLDFDEIIKQKSVVCNKANKRIVKQNDNLRRLHNTFKCRLSNYLRALNKNKDHEQIELTFDIQPIVLKEWDYNNPNSIPDENGLGEII